MIYELRIYEVLDGYSDAFRRRLVEDIVPILKRLGIEPVGFWISTRPDDTITYMTCGRDEETLDRAWQAFEIDDEWHALKRETDPEGKWLKRIEVRRLREYKPE